MNDLSHTVDPCTIPEVVELLEYFRRRMALSAEEATKTQPEFEQGLREATLKVERAVHTLDFARLDVDVSGIVIGEDRYRRREAKTTGHYMTLAGPIEVERTTYRARGGHGGETVAALDLRLGLIDGHWTPVAAQVGSAFMASVPSSEAALLLEAAGSMTPSASHLDRVAKRIGEKWESDRATFEEAVREAEKLDLPSPDQVHLLAISLDGIMVPMKDAPRAARRGKKDTGPKGHKEASSGTIASYDEAGKRLHTVRVARMPEAYKRTLHEQLEAELRTLRERYPDAVVVAVADGARENWRILGQIAAQLGIDVVERLDYYHAAQHLTEALRAAKLDDDKTSAWRKRLRDEPEVLEPLLSELGFLAAAAKTKKRKKTIETAFEYFINNATRIDYGEAGAANQPIGSGVQEAACKTLVAQRMKHSGMTWRTPGGQAVLTLRSLVQSGRLAHAWSAIRPTLSTPFDIDPSLRRKPPARAAA